MKNIIEILENYKEENKDNALKAVVIEDLLSYSNNNEYLENHINDVCQYGCVSGSVSSLIYYSDTEKFFKDYTSEIFELMQEYKDSFGEYPLAANNEQFDMNMNNLAWFAYEYVCNELQYEIEEI